MPAKVPLPMRGTLDMGAIQRNGTKEKKGVHGVGLAITQQSVVDGMEKGRPDGEVLQRTTDEGRNVTH